MFLARILINGVCPAPIHPPLWPEQTGLCAIFLFATDKDDAWQRARTILETLPFVLLDDHDQQPAPRTPRAIIYDLDAPRRTGHRLL